MTWELCYLDIGEQEFLLFKFLDEVGGGRLTIFKYFA